MSDNIFQQPTLEGNDKATGEALPASATQPQADNTGKTDELSAAVAAEKKITPPEPEKPRPPGKYILDYVLHGTAIRETHETIRLALARIRSLKVIGIVPATSTKE